MPTKRTTPNRGNTSPGKKTAAGGQKAIKAMRKQGMSTNLKLTLGAVGLAAVIVVIALVTSMGGGGSAPTSAADERLVRPSSHKLSAAADGKVTVVEFLDFECEACGAAYPGVEKLRKEYDGKITYVVRFFPLPGHKNAIPAAKAVQAAAAQGKFEQMYNKMFDTQATWGDQPADHTATFEQFAKDIGLDMDRYRTDLASQATADFVAAEQADGKALKLTGTPTFFINGTKFTGQPTYDGLKTAIDKALAA